MVEIQGQATTGRLTNPSWGTQGYPMAQPHCLLGHSKIFKAHLWNTNGLGFDCLVPWAEDTLLVIKRGWEVYYLSWEFIGKIIYKCIKFNKYRVFTLKFSFTVEMAVFNDENRFAM